MILPWEIRSLIDGTLHNIYRYEQHQISEKQRHAIYLTLHPSLDLTENTFRKVLKTRRIDMSFGYYVYGYLAIMTADYVLPFWEHYAPGMIGFDSNKLRLPREMVAAAEGILQGLVSIDEVLADFGTVFHEFEDVWYSVDFDTYWAGDSAHAALSMILGVPPVDHRGLTGCNDAAYVAEMAFSMIDLAYPLDRIKHEPFFQVDLQKRLEFWEWWLTKAIPVAWERAMEHTDATS